LFYLLKMNEVPITHSTLNVNSQMKCKAKNSIKNIFHSTELSFIGQRQKYQKHSREHENTAEDISGEESFSPFPWRLISSVLGAICLLLMAVAIASDRHSFPRTSSSLPRELGLVQMQLLLLLQGNAKLEKESACLLVSQFQSHKDKQRRD
ncbi:hypothetical protein A6R68_21806, partial [Neotoma lepida]